MQVTRLLGTTYGLSGNNQNVKTQDHPALDSPKAGSIRKVCTTENLYVLVSELLPSNGLSNGFRVLSVSQFAGDVPIQALR